MKIDVTETVEQQADVSVLRRRVCGLLEQVQLILDVSECGGFQTVSDNTDKLPAYYCTCCQTMSYYTLLPPKSTQYRKRVFALQLRTPAKHSSTHYLHGSLYRP